MVSFQLARAFAASPWLNGIIPDSVDSIGDFAFLATNIKTLEIPGNTQNSEDIYRYTPGDIELIRRDKTSTPVVSSNEANAADNSLNNAESVIDLISSSSIGDIVLPDEFTKVNLDNAYKFKGYTVRSSITGTNKKDKITGTSESEILKVALGKTLKEALEQQFLYQENTIRKEKSR